MVSDLKKFAYKGYKTAAQKKRSFFDEFCLTSRNVLVSVLLSASVERCFVSRAQDFFLHKKMLNFLALLWQKYSKYFCSCDKYVNRATCLFIVLFHVTFLPTNPIYFAWLMKFAINYIIYTFYFYTFLICTFSKNCTFCFLAPIA